MSLARYNAPETLPQMCCMEEMHEHANGELECLSCGHTLPADHEVSDVHDFDLTGDVVQQMQEARDNEEDARS